LLKYILLFPVVLILVVGVFNVFQKSMGASSIDGLMAHFQKEGLTVVETQPTTDPKEKAYIESVEKAFAPFAKGKPYFTKRSKIINSVRVDIYRYDDPKKAKEEHERSVEHQNREIVLVEALGQTYKQRVTYLLHGNFRLRIPHFTVRLEGNTIYPVPIQIDEQNLAKIEKALESF